MATQNTCCVPVTWHELCIAAVRIHMQSRMMPPPRTTALLGGHTTNNISNNVSHKRKAPEPAALPARGGGGYADMTESETESQQPTRAGAGGLFAGMTPQGGKQDKRNKVGTLACMRCDRRIIYVLTWLIRSMSLQLSVLKS